MSGGSEKPASCPKCGEAKTESARSLCPDCRPSEVDSLIEGINPGIDAGARAEADDEHPGSLRIEGLSEIHWDADSWSIKCPICDSTLLVTKEQVGSKIKCGDCYSKVSVLPPEGEERDASPKERPPQPKLRRGGTADDATKEQPEPSKAASDFGDSGELTLAPPIELGEELKGLQQEASPLEEITEEDVIEDEQVDPVIELSDPINLSPVVEHDPIQLVEPAILPDVPVAGKEVPKVDDPFADDGSDDQDSDEMIELIDMPPEIANADVSSAAPVALPRVPRRKKTPDPVKVEDDTPVRVHAKKKQKKSRRERLDDVDQAKAKHAENFYRLSSGGPGGAFDKSLGMLQSIGVYIWAGVAIVLLWAGNAGWHAFGPGTSAEDATMAQDIVAWGVGMAVGRVPCWIGYTLLLFVSGVIFREAAQGETKVEEVKATDGADFFSTMLLFGFSMFIAALPWLMSCLLCVILPLQFLLAVVFLVCAWHNRMPFAIVSGAIFSSFSQCREGWLVWGKCVALLVVSVAIGGGLMDLTYSGISVFTSLVGAILVTVATLIYAAITGWFAGEVSVTLGGEDV